MTLITLVVCTVGRASELERLLVSLDHQTCQDFEVLVVDQNADNRLDQILRSHPNLRIAHLQSEPGLSRARNVALSHAKGDIVCFPDDDCWYPPDLMESVIKWFQAHPDFGGLLTCLRDSKNDLVGPRWPTEPCPATRENIWFVGISAVAFLRGDLAVKVGSFDELIGIGAQSNYQSGEETDYFLRALKFGYKLWFDPSLTVHHPSLHSVDRLRRTTYTYALGGGYVLRRHHYPLQYFAWMVARSLGGAAISLLKADTENARIYVIRAAGQICGYFWGPRDLARLRARVN